MKRPNVTKPVQRVYGIPKGITLDDARRILRSYGLCIRPSAEGATDLFECCTRGDAYEVADVYFTSDLTRIVKDQIKAWRRRNLPVHEW